MDPDDLRDEIRSALDSRLVPSPGLETRVLAALALTPGRVARPAPRAAGLAAVLLAAVVVGSVALWSRGLPHAPAGRPVNRWPAVAAAQFTSSGAGWVVLSEPGDRGVPQFAVTVNRTEDGGATWHEQLRLEGFQPGVRADPDGQHAVFWISFANLIQCPTPPPPRTPGSGTCSTGAELHVYQTADAGLHWTPVTPSQPGEVGYFLDSKHGWLLVPGRQSWTLDRTEDGGRTWARLGEVASPTIVSDSTLTFSDQDTGWLVLGTHAAPGHTGLLVTHDGGHTWSEVTMPLATVGVTWQTAAQAPTLTGRQGVLLLMAHRDPSTTPASAARPAVVADQFDTPLLSTTSDGGRTWSAPSPPQQEMGPSLTPQAFFLDARHWWLVSIPLPPSGRVSSPNLLVTADGGATWQTHRVPQLGPMWFVDDRDGWAADYGGRSVTFGLLHTTDGGATWTRVAALPDPVPGQRT